MEQRTGSSSQPLTGAGFDPAFIPGLTAPASGAEATPKKADDDAADATGPEDSAAPDAAGPEQSEEPETAAPEAEGPAPSEEEAGPGPDGPVFEASDFRARIVADHRGVRLRLDDQECEFRWDEIGAVETESPRFGKRYTVTVHTPDRRWYPIEIVAGSRSQHQEWDTRLDEVLDAYFEDAEAEADGAAGPDTEDAGDA
ncbi:hypothetical protein ABZ354_25365 [Streptomyces sp. NPDC005925]|uniref:hypothetical protein n=1 Tax=Streptomyces sp. NPDC005925 TaxID=3157172 RepID=UPI0033DD54F8